MGFRRVKKSVRSLMVPPGLWEAARRFVRRRHAIDRANSAPQHPTPLAEILCPRPGPEPNWIQAEKIVNRFGQSFTTEQHHFVRYLESGDDSFGLFYQIHQPKTALEAKFINESFPGPSGTGVFDVPWQQAPLALTDTPARSPVFFGPISRPELATEAARLERVRRSVKKHGFRAEPGGVPSGGIEGQLFYKDNDDFRVVVTEGNHRTAVLVHLGWKLIPILHSGGLHPVRLSDLAKWPGVLDGRFTEEAAHAMFEAFFRPSRQQTLPCW